MTLTVLAIAAGLPAAIVAIGVLVFAVAHYDQARKRAK